MKIPPFYISSRGHSATAWLASMFSSHPEIVCFHGTRCVPPYPSGTVPDMTPEKFIDSLAVCAKSSHVKSFGAIHGFYGVGCKDAVERAGGRFAAIMRNPIKRIHSCLVHAHGKQILPDQLKNDDKPSSSIYTIIVDRQLNKVLSRTDNNGNLMVSDMEKIFYDYCRSFLYFDLICLKEAGPEANFRMEDLVSSKDDFLKLFDYVTLGLIKYDDTYVELIDCKKKINVHTKSESAEAIYESWPVSFKYLFHKAIIDNGGDSVYSIYEEKGYLLPKNSIEKFDIYSV